MCAGPQNILVAINTIEAPQQENIPGVECLQNNEILDPKWLQDQ